MGVVPRGVGVGMGGGQSFATSGRNSSYKPDSPLKPFFLTYQQTVMSRCFSHVSGGREMLVLTERGDDTRAELKLILLVLMGDRKARI